MSKYQNVQKYGKRVMPMITVRVRVGMQAGVKMPERERGQCFTRICMRAELDKERKQSGLALNTDRSETRLAEEHR